MHDTNLSHGRGSTQPVSVPAIESEGFALEMLDCGPGYSYGAADNLCACFRCTCGSGCLCGCVTPENPV